ncbi:unnamed protein product [Allacma fusca]|uniref:Uncharacterized protein n=1 Tax=Allacma fusca TaxID=39272 RepID=A0A8J2P6H1_9HEXA|nr:unnamed protein product [Allacma fusca]
MYNAGALKLEHIQPPQKLSLLIKSNKIQNPVELPAVEEGIFYEYPSDEDRSFDEYPDDEEETFDEYSAYEEETFNEYTSDEEEPFPEDYF